MPLPSSPPASRDTIASYMDTQKGFTSGFDYLRLILALSVLSWHTAALCFGNEQALEIIHMPFVRYPVRLILPMFFALSGFLVANSYERVKNLKAFLSLRLIRIMPALSVEVILSALLLGPLLTVVPLKTYFTDHAFRDYFLNVFGWIHFVLPGMFQNNPYPNIVNGSLWTVPFELECYLALSFLMITRLYRKQALFIASLLAITVAVWALDKHDGLKFTFQALPGRTLVLYFLGGIAINRLKDFLPLTPIFFWISAGLSLFLMGNDTLLYFSPIAVGYMTVYLGLLNPKKLPLLFTGDYSYGIYLYAFPMQQTVAHLFTTTWYIHLPLSILLTSLFAVFSWHAVEKPMQKLKRFISHPIFKPMQQALVQQVIEETGTTDLSQRKAFYQNTSAQ